tara:strand:+ start:203 stop:376 length:174 start_codon:yes stop_codon:yes gene_type:complete
MHNHQYLITCGTTAKIINVEGTQEYAVSYISGYVQALRDKYGSLIFIKVTEIEEREA